ncbi:3-dehydroquinate synthase [Desulforamulus ruminis]|uniref:3-dehydroquinate synthase n=1 Tax=Desulforamulus ruminis (strain ATCC 23193 / DSM 2154 / NCIMB 8452 / DL) TaxID=696281 RepID=F6DUE0_DESRL|nr:3-dehydroquinate synthase [Desulforamulus ruminis]AEG61325.1 3-dehydroquinate synthase [Desulforamulus ruminis DSM 2154]
MRTLGVVLGNRSYPIHIGSNLLKKLPELLAPLTLGQKVLLVTDTNVWPLYGQQVETVLLEAGYRVTTERVPAGETTKTLQQAERLYDAALGQMLDRTCPVVALGGGVVGDLAGFVASTYMRGVPFIQIPTTLLAQVDSSVGGKVAVNHPRGKNMIGSFYQPKGVIIDVHTLQTLNDRELRAGLAEVIKCGIIWDAAFFAWLEEHLTGLLQRNPELLARVVEICCQIKAAVVEQDETEQGRRAILNCGHTIGHAVEHQSGYGTYLHGEAVAIGMNIEARLARNLGLLTPGEAERIQGLLLRAGLPVELPADRRALEMLQSMYADKKATGDQLTFALPAGIGACKVIRGLDELEVKKVLDL